jgi:hypothetical protein
MKKYLLVVLTLTTLATQAGVFKCKTSDGFVYSEKPCPTGTLAGSIQARPASGQLPSGQSGTKSASAASSPIPDNQRSFYDAFLSKPNPKAFAICSDGRAMEFVGKGDFVKQKLASLPEGCAPYAIDDAVVWSGK